MDESVKDIFAMLMNINGHLEGIKYAVFLLCGINVLRWIWPRK